MIKYVNKFDLPDFSKSTIIYCSQLEESGNIVSYNFFQKMYNLIVEYGYKTA